MTTSRNIVPAIANDPQRVLMVGLLAVLCVFFGVRFPAFASFGSAFSILEGFAVIGLVTLGLTVTIIAGEIDLSVGSLAALTGVLVVEFVGPLGPFLAVAIGLGVSLAIGIAQGYVIARLRIQAIVLTIGSLVFFRGLSLIVAGERTVSLTQFEASDFIEKRMFLFSPASLLVLSLFLAAGVFLKFNRFAREIYAVGGARREALAAGVPLIRPLVITFAISGFCAGLPERSSDLDPGRLSRLDFKISSCRASPLLSWAASTLWADAARRPEPRWGR